MLTDVDELYLKGGFCSPQNVKSKEASSENFGKSLFRLPLSWDDETFCFENSGCRGKMEIDSRGTLCIFFCTRLLLLAQPATVSRGNSADT